jgi:hypothetical protein
MKAAFMTEGRTMTHSALFRRSAGISSGTEVDPKVKTIFLLQ